MANSLTYAVRGFDALQLRLIHPTEDFVDLPIALPNL